MTDRERLDQIRGLLQGALRDDQHPSVREALKRLEVLDGERRRLLAVEEAARPGWQFLPGLRYALADLDEWRKEQP